DAVNTLGLTLTNAVALTNSSFTIDSMSARGSNLTFNTGTVTVTGNNSITTNATIANGAMGLIAFDNPISGSGSLTLSGGGPVRLGGDNSSWTGGLISTGGTLSLTNNNS